MTSGLTFAELGSLLRDQAAPIAVPRLDVMQRNPRIGHVLMSVPPAKAAVLGRQIATISSRTSPTYGDVILINAAARKRARKFARAQSQSPVSSSIN